MSRGAALGRVARPLALGVYGALLFATAPRWPDDWDGVGFLESVRDFDLSRFRPHPPGYPVYVALLRVAALVAGSPMGAGVLVAVASGVATAALSWGSVRQLVGERAAWMAAISIAVAPIAWRACSGVGSEAPALACAAACAWGLAAVRARPGGRGMGGVVLGIAGGLGLGVRLSWAPLYLSALALCPREARARASLVGGATCLAWVVPLIALVGPSRLAGIYAVHFAGHARRWGGTLFTEPGPARLGWLLRDVLCDGLGIGPDAPGLAIGGLGLVATALGWSAWRDRGWGGGRAFLTAAGPYTLWIALGQNLRDQPRHALPLVALIAGAVGLLAARSRAASCVAGALVAAIAWRTAIDARARMTIPPPAAQLVALLRAQPAPASVAVFGAASVRFFEGTELAGRAWPAASLGDVSLQLTRLDELPSRVWVTGELEGLESSPWPLDRVATLCRPPRLDRRRPCIDVFEWRLPFLPR